MDSLLEEFNSFISQFSLSKPVVENANTFLTEVGSVVIQLGQKINKKALFACAVFIAAQTSADLHKLEYEEIEVQPEITVSKLLEKAEISIMDFFSVTCFLKTSCNLSEEVKLNFIALERKYLIVSALYDKFESMVNEIFYSGSEAVQVTLTDKDNRASSILKNHKILCWLLFVVAKAKVMWHRQELLATFHLLLCCIGEIIRITPSFLLLPPFDCIDRKKENLFSVLEALSIHFKTKFEEVKAVYNGWLHVASELRSGNQFHEIEDLQRIYSHLYVQNGDIDESLFLVRDWHLFPSTSENISSPRKFYLTSVRRTLDTAEALNTILMSAPDDLTLSLKVCLEKCSFDAATFIKEFLNHSKITFISQFVQAHEGSNESLAERRFKLAARFYYIMLDALLKKESERLSQAGFTSFLQSDVFHKSLLACCLEVTLMSCGTIGSINFTPLTHGNNYQIQGISFPWILEVFHLEPFIFFKIIESFIRSAPTITSQIINHLKSIEDKILDSLAWQSNSSVFAAISGNGCSPSCRVKFGSTQQSPGIRSPNKNVSQQSPITPHRCQAVNIFLKKVCHLGYQRLERICNLLELDKEILSNIWTCVEHILYDKTYLLKDRHLDQLIMCCIFGVCKMSDKPVLFKNIIFCYGQLPNTSVSVYKNVLSKGNRQHIFHFNNNEFSEEMLEFITKKFGNGKEISLAKNITSSPVVLSPLYSLPKKKNIFISSMPESPFKNPNEIILRKPYTVGSLTQSSKMLQDINISLNSSPLPKNAGETKVRKRLLFDSEENKSCVKSPTLSSAKKFLKF